MARIFNIYFTYADVMHGAIVSVRTTSFFTEYILGNLDEEVKEQLPSTVIISQPGTALYFQHGAQHSKELVSIIINSLAAHIYTDGNVVSER